MKCVAFSGIFIDINDNDMRNNRDFGMIYLCGDRNYKAVNVANLFRPENTAARKVSLTLTRPEKNYYDNSFHNFCV